MDAGFENIKIGIEKRQGMSIFWLILPYPPVKIFGASAVADSKKQISRY